MLVFKRIVLLKAQNAAGGGFGLQILSYFTTLTYRGWFLQLFVNVSASFHICTYFHIQEARFSVTLDTQLPVMCSVPLKDIASLTQE